MGKVVSAVATSHILMSKNGAEEPAARVFDGMMRIGRHVRESKPDVIVIISNDHMFNVGPSITAPFMIACGGHFVPFGEMDIPREEYRGKPEFASALASFAEQNGLPLHRLETLRPDHGTAVPLLFANPDRDVPIVPIFVNYDRSPPPSPTDCWKLGTLLQHFIAVARPQSERVALIGAGGLSHWVGYENPTVNEEFDRRFLAAMASGDLNTWRERPAAAIRREAGNGGLEIMSWLTMAAVVPEARAEVVYYEAMPSWMTGMGGVVMKWRESTRS